MGNPAQVASIGFSLASTAVSVAGERSEAQFQERRAKINQRVGVTRANQLDAAFRDELNRTLSNIDAIRASAGASSFSPTSAAIKDRQRKTSGRNRRARVDSELIQAEQSGEDAKFFKSAAKSALLGGVVRSLPQFLSLGQLSGAGGG